MHAFDPAFFGVTERKPFCTDDGCTIDPYLDFPYKHYISQEVNVQRATQDNTILFSSIVELYSERDTDPSSDSVIEME